MLGLSHRALATDKDEAKCIIFNPFSSKFWDLMATRGRGDSLDYEKDLVSWSASQLQTVLKEEQRENESLRRDLQRTREECKYIAAKEALLSGRDCVDPAIDGLGSLQEISVSYMHLTSLLAEMRSNLQVAKVFCLIKYPGEFNDSQRDWALCSEYAGGNLMPLFFPDDRPMLQTSNSVDSGIFEVPVDSPLYTSIRNTGIPLNHSNYTLLCIPIDPGTGGEASIFWFFEGNLSSENISAIVSRLQIFRVRTPTRTKSLLHAVSSEVFRIVSEFVTMERFLQCRAIRECAASITSLFANESSTTSDRANCWSKISRNPDILQSLIAPAHGVKVIACDVYVASLTGGFLLDSALSVVPLDDQSCYRLFDINKGTLFEALSSNSPVVYHDKSSTLDSCEGMALFILWMTDEGITETGSSLTGTSTVAGGSDLIYASFVVYRFEGFLSDFTILPLQRDMLALVGPSVKKFVDSNIVDIFDPLSTRRRTQNTLVSCPSSSNSLFSPFSSLSPPFYSHSTTHKTAELYRVCENVINRLVVDGAWRKFEGETVGFTAVLAQMFESSWVKVLFFLKNGSEAIVLDEGRAGTILDVSHAGGDLKDALTELIVAHHEKDTRGESAEKMIVVNDMENETSGLLDFLDIREEFSSSTYIPKRSHVVLFNLYSHDFFHRDDNHEGDLVVLCGRSWKPYDAEVTEKIAEAVSNVVSLLMKNAIPIKEKTIYSKDQEIHDVARSRVRSIIGRTCMATEKDKINWAFRCHCIKKTPILIIRTFYFVRNVSSHLNIHISANTAELGSLMFTFVIKKSTMDWSGI